LSFLGFGVPPAASTPSRASPASGGSQSRGREGATPAAGARGSASGVRIGSVEAAAASLAALLMEKPELRAVSGPSIVLQQGQDFQRLAASGARAAEAAAARADAKAAARAPPPSPLLPRHPVPTSPAAAAAAALRGVAGAHPFPPPPTPPQQQQRAAPPSLFASPPAARGAAAGGGGAGELQPPPQHAAAPVRLPSGAAVDVAAVAAGGEAVAGFGDAERAALPAALARALLDARAAVAAARADAAALQRRLDALTGGGAAVEELNAARLALAQKLEDTLAEVRALKAALAAAREGAGDAAAAAASDSAHEEREAVPAEGADPFAFAVDGGTWT
jgi:hypothetical protein